MKRLYIKAVSSITAKEMTIPVKIVPAIRTSALTIEPTAVGNTTLLKSETQENTYSIYSGETINIEYTALSISGEKANDVIEWRIVANNSALMTIEEAKKAGYITSTSKFDNNILTVQTNSKNNDILKSALRTSKSLGQLLSNMQDGMRSYFDELSSQKHFIGIQQVLVEEINNSDSKKYAILTTTDSFYRYKEAVKELISEILNENDEKKAVLLKEKKSLEAGTLLQKRNEYRLQYCEDTSRIVLQLEREFGMIERKYNKLIEQKTVFAKRALARIHYILQEGVSEEDNIIKLINLLDRSEKKDEILVEMRERVRFSSQFKNITDNSFAGRRDRGDGAFTPVMLDEEIDAREQHMTDFVPKPLYTRNELQSFRRKNTVDGIFVATEETVQSVEDLEKLLFLWQEETEERLAEDTVSVDGEIRSEDGLTYSRLVIGQNK